MVRLPKAITFDNFGAIIDWEGEIAKFFSKILAREILGLEVKDILHAGFGFKYDVVPGTQLGYETCWINRQGEVRPVDVHETYLCGDLRTLAYNIKGMAATIEGK